MKWLVLVGLVFFIGQSYGQDPVADEESFDERYARNIKKSRINGVYIPKNLDEAIAELIDLSTQESLEKFKKGEEQEVSRKLHFGIGRWMIYNWNFYEGSRFSHYLKEMGLSHPDDQAQLVIVSLHRHLNGKKLDAEEQIANFAKARAMQRDSKVKVLKEETRKRQNEQP